MSNNHPSSSNRQSTIQTNIHEAMAKISKQARKRTLLPPRQSKPASATEVSAVPSTSTASRTTTNPSTSSSSSTSVSKSIGEKWPPSEPNDTSNAEKTQLLSNAYALELFFRHTNIMQVVARKYPYRSENTHRKVVEQLFQKYVLEPEQRIREHLHEMRFDDRFHEGLLCMAIKVPLTSEQNWRTYKETLAKAGIRKLCFVDMTVSNRVLEYQQKTVRKLQSQFKNWSAKLNKLPAYLIMYQQKREAEDRKFLSLLKHYSTLKHNWTPQLPIVLDELQRERWLPSEKRTNLLWSELRFDDDDLNRKYEVGNYSKFRFNVEVDPADVHEPSSLVIDLPDDDERCSTPVNAPSNRRLTVARVDQATIVEEEQMQLDQATALPADENPPLTVGANTTVPTSEHEPRNHQNFAMPVHTVREIIEILDSPAKTNSTVNVGYTFDYVTRCTNIYEVVIKKYLERHRDINLCLVQSKADTFVRMFYKRNTNMFKRNELPVGIRLLTPHEQQEQTVKGPMVWAVERLNIPNAKLQLNSENVQIVLVEASPNPTPSVQQQPPAPRCPPVANQPKPKQKKMNRIQPVPCTIRTARIVYDSDSSQSLSDLVQPDRDDGATNEAAHHSIAFVQIVADSASQALEQQENTPQSQDFTPVASSTQQQSPLYRRRSAPQPACTQDPLQMSGTSTTTIPPFNAIVPFVESNSKDTQTPTPPTQSQSQPTSSIIPPFQLVNVTPDVPPVSIIHSSPAVSQACLTVKQEALSELSADKSGYADYVEFVEIPDDVIIIIDSPPAEDGMHFSDFNQTIDLINTRVNGILERKDDICTEAENYLSCGEPTTSNSSLEGRLKRSVKVEPDADRPISPPRIGPYVTFETPRKARSRQALVPLAATATTTQNCPRNAHMMFLYKLHIQSIRYSTIPTTWSQCGVFQANPLTIHLNPGSAGFFSVPVCDLEACLLLMGLPPGSKGAEALLAALEYVKKFRYGPKEPEREYYRLSITEKVLYLFCACIPPCPQDGGLVMFPKSKSSVPADGDEMWLERFNYYAHVKPKQRRHPSSDGKDKSDGEHGNGAESLAKLLMPDIGLRMKALREKLVQRSGAIVV